MAGPESKFYSEIKKSWTKFNLTRIENISIPGVPDLLCYNKNHFFFTVEIKVTTNNKLRFSPHQIAFHIRHPLNTFIIAKSLGHGTVKLYEGQQIEELAACGLALDACCLGLDACGLWLAELGAWGLALQVPATLFNRAQSWSILVLTIGNILNWLVPACPAVPAFVVLLWSWATCASLHNGRSIRPWGRRCLGHHWPAESNY